MSIVDAIQLKIALCRERLFVYISIYINVQLPSSHRSLTAYLLPIRESAFPRVITLAIIWEVVFLIVSHLGDVLL